MDAILLKEHPLSFHTQYAELSERVRSLQYLLPGTPGSLKLKRVKPEHDYWYRIYYAIPGRKVEEVVCAASDTNALEEMQESMAFHGWVEEQLSHLRKLNFQVADKQTARVLVELFNTGIFNAGLVLVGTLAYMAWLNELGVHAISSRTQDIDIARKQALKLGAPLSFLRTMQATSLPFVPVPGLPSTTPSTSVKLRGVEGLRVDVLAPGNRLGSTVKLPELEWAAQAIPFYDYLLDAPQDAVMLAGGHCIPVKLPQAARLALHKLYASRQRGTDRAKAAKDRQQAAVLAAAIEQSDSGALKRAYAAAPVKLQRALVPALPELINALAHYPEAAEALTKLIQASN